MFEYNRLLPVLGSVVCGLVGDNSARISREEESRHFKPFSLHFPQRRSSLLADSFASISCTAQIGHFQKLFLDLTRFHARLDCLSVSTFLNGSSHLIKDWYRSQKYDPNAVHAVCPDVTLSFQQQVDALNRSEFSSHLFLLFQQLVITFCALTWGGALQIVGPISFRAESRLGIDKKSQGRFAHSEEHIFALEYAMQVLGSARATAWYSPKRQEAMVELRFFES